MPNPLTTLRLSPQDEALLSELQQRLGAGRTDIIREAIRHLHAREWPAPICGYIALDRPGDLGPEDECPECGQTLGWPVYVAVTSDGGLSGPLCARCASSE